MGPRHSGGPIGSLTKAMRKLLSSVSVALLLGGSLLSAATYTEIVSFGDSMTDGGNTNELTFGLTPNGDYYGSRSFTNGPVWVEVLAQVLGLPIPKASQLGGARATNYAYGGAESGDGLSNPVDPFPLDLRNVGWQIDEFIADGRTLTENSIVTLWIGGNCLVGVPTGAQAAADNAVATLAAHIKTHLEELIGLGAKTLVTPNLPLLGTVPRNNSPASTGTFFNNLTAAFNNEHAKVIKRLRRNNPGIRIISPDTAALLNAALANPGNFGFTNSTDAAYESGIGGSSLGSTTVPNPEQYLFWDDLHPSGRVHDLLGRLAADLATRLPRAERLVINEIDADQPGTSESAEFVEIYNPSNGAQSLQGLSLVLFNGNNGNEYRRIHLTGTVAPNGFYVIGDSGVPNLDRALSDFNLQNGPDGIALIPRNLLSWFPNSPLDINAIQSSWVIAGAVYGTNDPDASALLDILTPGRTQANEGQGGNAFSASRFPDGSGAFAIHHPTPGESNQGGVILDFDEDGLIDSWEIEHFGDLSKDGTEDLDGDGFTTLKELTVLLTDPFDGNSTLRPVVRRVGNGHSLRIPTIGGRTYRLEWSATLKHDWSLLTSFLGTDQEVEVQLGPLNASRQFYRVGVSLSE